MEDIRKSKIKTVVLASLLADITNSREKHSETVRAMIDGLKQLRSLVIRVVIEYDVYYSNLIRRIFQKKPELFFTINSEFCLSDIKGLKNIKDIKEYILEKKIDRLLRKSHLKQIKWLSNISKIDFVKKITYISGFLELCERRNIYVHRDGKISHEYLSLCKQFKINISADYKLNSPLNISRTYFNDAIANTLMTVLSMDYLLRDYFVSKEKSKLIDEYIDMLILLDIQQLYKISVELANFLLSDKNIKMSDRRIIMINKAISLKLSGDTGNFDTSMNAINWNTKNQMILMARLVLLDDFKAAARKMRKVCGRKQFSKYNNDEYFRIWPLFLNFRKSKEFLQEYKKIYKRDFVPMTLSLDGSSFIKALLT